MAYRSLPLLLVAASTCLLQHVACLNPTVTLAQGTVVGTTTVLPSATASVFQYLGVPFALSPPRRFVPPQPVSSSSSTIVAQKWKPKCIETVVDPPLTDTLAESEDCLYLNIYTPSGTSATKRAVMFWLYGGSLQFGNAGQPFYDGSSFATNQDVVVVTTNYRTNIFGFSNSPDLGLTSRNAGLYDQRLALQWVQNNIAKFGGDPTKVTIFGESSGASSVDRLLTAPPQGQLPYRAAILQSGQATVSLASDYSGPFNWAKVVSAVGCSGSNELSCMQTINASSIKAAVMNQSLTFLPQNDNVTQKATPLVVARAQGSAAAVPLLAGTNGYEASLFLAAAAKSIPVLNGTTVDILINATVGPALYPFARAIIDPVQNEGASVIFFTLSRFITDYIYTCPVSLVAQSSNQARNPTWRYLFNATFPDSQKSVGYNGVPNIGAFHTSEVALVFGTYRFYSSYAPSTKDEATLSKFMQGAWASFAKNPTAGPGWVGLASNNQSIGCLGCSASPTGVSFVSSSTVDQPCPLYTNFYIADLPGY